MGSSIENLANLEDKEDLLREFKRLLEFPLSQKSVRRLASELKSKTKLEEIKGTITTVALAVGNKKYTRSRYKKIKVQPTSISRRLPKGRNSILQNVLQRKREHKISKNVNENVLNAK